MRQCSSRPGASLNEAIRFSPRLSRYNLTDVRALPADLLARLGKMGLVREGIGGTAWFLHQVHSMPVGWEMRGPAYKGFAAGGRKTLFVLTESRRPKAVMVCEGATDALSLAVLDGFNPVTAYVSTGGGWGDGGRDALLGLARDCAVLIAGPDRVIAGEKLAARLEQLAGEAGSAFERRLPETKDWNDKLVAVRDPGRFD